MDVLQSRDSETFQLNASKTHKTGARAICLAMELSRVPMCIPRTYTQGAVEL